MQFGCSFLCGILEFDFGRISKKNEIATIKNRKCFRRIRDATKIDRIKGTQIREEVEVQQTEKTKTTEDLGYLDNEENYFNRKLKLLAQHITGALLLECCY